MLQGNTHSIILFKKQSREVVWIGILSKVIPIHISSNKNRKLIILAYILQHVFFNDHLFHKNLLMVDFSYQNICKLQLLLLDRGKVSITPFHSIAVQNK